jgi:hypothetical protein
VSPDFVQPTPGVALLAGISQAESIRFGARQGLITVTPVRRPAVTEPRSREKLRTSDCTRVPCVPGDRAKPLIPSRAAGTFTP